MTPAPSFACRSGRSWTRFGPWPGLLLLLLCQVALATELPAEVSRALRQHKLDASDLSLYLRVATETAPRLAVSADTPRIPASTIKLLTSIAALDALGPSYRWQTRAYLAGELSDGRLDGDLIIAGGGDPSLDTEDLWRFLWELKARGLEQIGGDLVIDNSLFEADETGRDAFDGAGERPYNALPVAFSVADQVTRIELSRTPADHGLRAHLMPPLSGVTLINKVRLIEAPCRSKDHRLWLKESAEGDVTRLTVTGTFASRCGDDRIERLVLDPVRHAGEATLAIWRSLGGRIIGGIREGRVPEGATPFYTQGSDELAIVVREINKHSNNLMTRTLFLTLGLEHGGPPGTLSKGRAAISKWLAEKGLDLPALVIDNGSGLSRETRISAGGMGRLLGWAYANPEMSELIASLPIIGVDGTLHRRLRHTPLRGRGHLKTGTLRGASALAGFLDDTAGRRWILVSMINDPRLQGWRGKAVEDSLLRWLYAGADGLPGGD